MSKNGRKNGLTKTRAAFLVGAAGLALAVTGGIAEMWWLAISGTVLATGALLAMTLGIHEFLVKIRSSQLKLSRELLSGKGERGREDELFHELADLKDRAEVSLDKIIANGELLASQGKFTADDSPAPTPGRKQTRINVSEDANVTTGEPPLRKMLKADQPGLERQTAHKFFGNLKGAETYALVTRSLAFRNVLAYLASDGHYDFREVMIILERCNAGEESMLALEKALDTNALLSLARVVGTQRFSKSDLEYALLIYSSLDRRGKVARLDLKTARVLGEVLAEAGEYRRARQLLRETGVEKRDPTQMHLMQANQILESGYSDHEWCEAVNKVFLDHGLGRVGLQCSADRSRYDSIENVGQLEEISGGPLISVIIPTFGGGQRINTAVNSLLCQTWQNIEILIVDDGSGDQEVALLRETISKHGEKVKLIELPENRGAYPARNAALEVAKGDFITVHDDDDWSHAQKLETQVRYLLENPTVAACYTCHVRADEQLRFLRINRSPQFVQKNLSSLMFRRWVFDQFGYWQDVNRGGDAEFYDRLRKVGKLEIKQASSAPLSFTRTHPSSLTSGEVSRGFMDPARRFYHSAYLHRHEEWIKQKATNFEISPNEIPTNLQPGKRGKHLGSFQTVVLGDFGEVNRAAAIGCGILTSAPCEDRVGLIHFYSPAGGGNVRVNARFHQLFDRPEIEILSPSDAAEIEELVIVDPDVIRFMDNLPVNISVGQVTILKPATGSNFERLDLLQAARKTFKPDRVEFQDAQSLIRKGSRSQAEIEANPTAADGADIAGNYGILVDSVSCRIEYVGPSKLAQTLQLADEATVRGNQENSPRFTVIRPTHWADTYLWLGSILAAIVRGDIVALPPEVGRDFGGACIYPESADLGEALALFVGEEDLWRHQVSRAKQWISGPIDLGGNDGV